MREPTFRRDITQPRRGRAILHRDKAKNRRPTKDNKGDDSDHFHQREPELPFGKKARGDNVQAKNNHTEHHAPDPYWHQRKPVLHTESGSGKTRTKRHGPGQPVEPGHGIPRRRAEIARGIDVKRPGLRHRDRQLAQTLHNQPDHQRANQIGQQRSRGPGSGDDVAGIEE